MTAALTTVEALMFSLRPRGTAALRERNTRRRLSELSNEQAIAVGNRLQRLEAWREAKAAPQPKNKPKAPPAVEAVGPVENAPPPDVGADNMRAQIAALDDGLDIPECLRRAP
jgi:hypothetical protein